MNSLNSILNQVSKPARYTGGEWNSITKKWEAIPIRIVLCYPDVYEIGMSNLALPILYEILNRQPDVLAERVYAPWVDMEAILRKQNIPLFSLESKHPVKEFDIVGFSLAYELTYTNVLNLLDLAQIPLFSSQRDDSHPLVIAGGSCTLNPEPMADFVDLFAIGEGEEIILELLEIFRTYRGNKGELLRQAARLDGTYIPSFYQVNYEKDGIVNNITPKIPEAKAKIQRRIVAKLPLPVTKAIVPYIETVHDHGNVEIQRGCTQGCRFCQAGMIYRPVRERSQEEVIAAVGKLSKDCGFSEVSLLSLSTGDYSNIEELVTKLYQQHYGDNLTLSLPSLRLNTTTVRLIDLLPSQRKISLTFAPEAGNERLRRVINKNIPEEVILETIAAALSRGQANIKLYFMLGLPSETTDDVYSIISLVSKIRRLKQNFRLHISTSTLIPKPHTPCQWLAQETEEQLLPKYDILRQGLHRLRVEFSWAAPKVSQIEAALSRGDRRIGKVIYSAWQSGCKFDAWHEHFNYQKWLEAFEQTGLDPSFYANRKRDLAEVLPWEHIDVGVTSEFLKREYHNLWQEKETPDCRQGKCNACGLQQWQISCRDKYKKIKGYTKTVQ
ncbi:MAG TPA: TIGR03960 family B12-binding radical SAM protein [Dehalococcoidia bacterium]|nr:TIGR03960 family B12-binding radical SAM protein [Dehalococcoidia bacterium]